MSRDPRTAYEHALAGDELPSSPWPAPVLDDKALFGVVGRTVEALRPHTEACDAAILALLLTELGNAIGRTPHIRVESDRHTCALFVALVGRSARGRKGTAGSRVRGLMNEAADGWAANAPFSGFGSGEGVITELAAGDRKGHQLLVDERELSVLLTIANRENSILSAVIRNGWDGLPLRRRIKGERMVVTDYHLSAVGHITDDELRRKLTVTEMANGFGNRWLWVYSDRSRRLPFGGDFGPDQMKYCGDELTKALALAERVEQITFGASARPRWEQIYNLVADSELPGLIGAITNRAEAYILRIALIHAVLAGSRVIDLPHLEAAWALWRYSEDTCRHIWGDLTGDPDLDKLVAAVRRAGDVGLSFTEAYERVFAKHRSVAPIAARGVRAGLLRIEREETDGRPREVMFPYAC